MNSSWYAESNGGWIQEPEAQAQILGFQD